MNKLICLISVYDKTPEQPYNIINAAILKFNKCQNLMEEKKIEQPQWQSSLTEEEIQSIMKRVGISREAVLDQERSFN